MDDLIKWKRFSIPMTTVFVIGLVEILFLHQYFGILGIIAFVLYLLYYNNDKYKIELDMNKIDKSTYINLENMQFKLLFLPAISYILIVPIISFVLEYYNIIVIFYILGTITFILIYLLYINKKQNACIKSNIIKLLSASFARACGW